MSGVENFGTWTSWSKASPEETDEYFVTWETCLPKGRQYRFIEIVEYDSEKDEWGDIPQAEHYGGADIVAWMPLPEPYEGD